jgi:hypothetical protein
MSGKLDTTCASELRVSKQAIYLSHKERIVARQQKSDIFCSRELNFVIKEEK